MRTAITVGIEHGSGKASVIHGSEIGLMDQIREFKKLPARSSHDKFSRVEIWDSSSGIIKSLKFSTPEADLKRKELITAQEAEHAAHLEKLAEKDSGKAEAKPEDKPKASKK